MKTGCYHAKNVGYPGQEQVPNQIPVNDGGVAEKYSPNEDAGCQHARHQDRVEQLPGKKTVDTEYKIEHKCLQGVDYMLLNVVQKADGTILRIFSLLVQLMD